MDVDGTLTDGSINISSNGELFKTFNVNDGYAIKHILPQLKIQPVIISGRKSIIIENRCRELGITLLFQDIIDKEDCLKKLQKELNVQPDETAGIGDDINDIPMLKICGINACPADALIADKVTIVCKKAGGKGAVREFIDYLINLSN